MQALSLVAGPLAALAVMMVAAGLALTRQPNRFKRALSPYAMPSAYEERVRRTRTPLREALPNMVGAWSAAAAEVPLVGQRVERLEPWLARQLVRADLSLTPRELVLVALGLVLGGVALGIMLWGTVLSGAIIALAGLGGLAGYVRYKQGQRLRTFGEQLPEVLAVLIIGLRAGLSVMQALDTISKQVRGPAAQEFSAVIHETRIGVPPDVALKHLAARVRNQDLHLLVNAVIIQRETGGNLVTMVETIEETVRERVKIRGEVRTLTAQASMGGWIITLLPVALFVFLNLINPSGMSFFWSDAIGLGLAGVAIFNVVLGNVILRKITRIEL